MSKKLAPDVKLRRLIRRTVESKKNYLEKPERANYRLIISTFLEKFVLCEAGTKRALSSYYRNAGTPRDVEDINMPLPDITAALDEAGFDVSSMELDKMYKKNNKRGEKSARDLRNAIVHDLTAEDIDELVNRWQEIQATLDRYLSILQRETLD